MATDILDYIDWLDVTQSTVAANGTITVQMGNAASGRVAEPNGEWLQHVGFCSRPPKSGAQCLALNASSGRISIGSRSIRSQKILGNLKEGETCVFATEGAARAICKADGSIVLYTTDDNTDDGKAVFLRISPKNGFEFHSPWGKLTFGPQGFLARNANGARIAMGAAGLPGPLAALGSVIKIGAPDALVNIEGAVVTAGSTAGVGDAATKALALEGILATITAAIAAIAAAAVGSGSGDAFRGAVAALAPTSVAAATAAAATTVAVAGSAVGVT